MRNVAGIADNIAQQNRFLQSDYFTNRLKSICSQVGLAIVVA